MNEGIVRIQNSEELLKRLRAETDGRVKSRLIFLNAIANHGFSYEKASEICGLSVVVFAGPKLTPRADPILTPYLS